MSHSKKQFIEDLKNLGIKAGDKVLIHSSFKALGGIEDSAKGFYDAFFELIGENGTLILPTLSYTPCYKTLEFDVAQTPSCVGYLSEFFRTEVEGAVRSVHPTHSCAAKGKDAEWFVENHELDDTPIGKNSPFYKLPLVGGKILMIGDINDHNTSLHGVEEAAEAPYVLDFSADPVEYKVTDRSGKTFSMKVRRHNIGQSGYIQRYSRITSLLKGDEISVGKLLNANATLMDATAVWERGIAAIKKDPYFFVDKSR